MLSSIIGKRRAVINNFRIRNNSANRLDNPPSPQSFVSPELFEISNESTPIPPHFTDSLRSSPEPVNGAPPSPELVVISIEPEHRTSEELEEPDESEDSEDVVLTQRAPCDVPRVQLEIDTGPAEWFPPDLLVSTFNFDGRSSPKPSLDLTSTRPHKNNSHAPSSFRLGKPVATTIDIPTSHDPHPYSNLSQLSPTHTSAISIDNMSSVSGTTLARALFGNSFTLSNDNRFSRHRTGLTRQDSTTLPRTASYYRLRERERRNSSGGETSPSIPPVPPMPANLDQYYRKRTSSLPDQPPDLRRTASASSLRSLLASYGDSAGLSTPGDSSATLQQQKSAEPLPLDVPPSSSTPPNGLAPPDLSKSTSSDPPKRPSLTFHHRTVSEPHSIPKSAASTFAIDSAYGFEFDSPGVKSPVVQTPYDADKSVSKKKPGEKAGLGVTLPATPRVDWILSRPSPTVLSPNAQSRTASYLPIGDRPRSLLPRSTDNASILASTPTRRSNLSPDPQRRQYLNPSTVFNRQRSGSTPNPITVTRDSQDFNTYNLTLATALPPPGSGTTATPTSAETDLDLTLRLDGRGRGTLQTFPETPNAFSPMWSASSATGFAGGSPLGIGESGMGITRSGSVPTVKHASLAQQMLLTRAATTVRGARTGMTRPRGLATSSMIGTGMVPGSMSGHPYANPRNNMLALLTPPPEETSEGSPGQEEEEDEVVESPSVTDLAVKETEQQQATPTVVNGLPTPQSQGSSSTQSDPHAHERPPVESQVPSRSPSLTSTGDISHGPSSTHPTLHNKSSVVGRMLIYNNNESKDTLSSSSIDKPLPPRPMRPPNGEVEGGVTLLDQVVEGAVVTAVTATATAMGCGGVCEGGTCALCTGSGGGSVVAQDVPAPSTPPPQLVRTPPPTSTPRSLPPQPDATQAARVVTPPAATSHLPTSPPSSPPPRLVRRFPPTPQTPSLFSTNNHHPTSSLTLSLGAPPPYYSVVPASENGIASSQRVQPSEGSDRGAPGYPASSPPPPNVNNGAGVISPDTSPRNQRNGRTRPPLPVGPRKQTSQTNILGGGSIDRNASVSSNGSGSGGSSGRMRAFSNASSSGPRFQTPPVKWRGYTMDAAKWTFTSQQLQGIVSRAIRQSSEASSIRLLKLETLDNQIPDEMHRLDMLGMDVKARYKALSRKRYNLLAVLSAQLERVGGEEAGDAAAAVTMAQKLVEELAETSVVLDQLAEELHSVDEQMAQLKSLKDIHSASALAMALRKLNSSFSKQLVEIQALHRHVEYLEAERDDAWKEAHEAATDYDDLTDHLRALEASTPNTAGSFTNSSSRRSSRVTAARMSSARVSRAGLRPSRSQRSSVSSVYRNNPASSARSTFHSPAVIPPLPPMPPHRPPGIVTADLPPTTSPSSETRALVRAQDELYAMLGIAEPPGSGTFLRRPRSACPESETTPVIPERSRPVSERSYRSERPLSYPGSIGRGSLMTDDQRQAMVSKLGWI